MTLEEIASKTNAWCDARGLVPASGQSARTLSERTLRYYRTVGLVDPPEHGGGSGYGDKHLYQLIAIRVLQAQGLPLGRIQTLLYGRTMEELQAVAARAGATVSAIPLSRFAPSPEESLEPRPCPGYSLGGGYMLVCSNGKPVAPGILCAISDLLSGASGSVPTTADNRQSTRKRTLRK